MPDSKALEWKLEGGKEALQRVEELTRRHEGAAYAALYQEGLELIRAAVKLTPIEFGVLRGSAYCGPPVRQADASAIVEAGFGTAYAVHVHERTGLRHERGEALYLRKAADARMPDFLQRLAKRIEANAARGITSDAIPALVPPSPLGRELTPAERSRRRAAERKAAAPKPKSPPKGKRKAPSKPRGGKR